MADWRLIIDPPGGPEANMASDEKIARQVQERAAPPTLRIYRWSRPAVSLGRRQKLETLPADIHEKSLPLVRRPTGGGAVLHSMDELTYAVAVLPSMIPAGVRLSAVPGRIHHFLRERLVLTGAVSADDLVLATSDSGGSYAVCFSAPVAGDLSFLGKKAAGSALRVWKEAVLIQGSVQGIPVKQEDLQGALMSAVEKIFGRAEGMGEIEWCRGGELNPDELTPTTP